MAILQYIRWLSLVVLAGTMVVAFALPMAAMMLIAYLKDRKKFTESVDRSSDPPPDPIPNLKHEAVNVNGIRLHVVSSGQNTGQRPLMLMLHGFPEFWYSWRHQLEAFRDTHDVVALDMRGYNTSDKPQGVARYSVLQLAADVREAVGALGRERCILVGHDWGGLVAWCVATLYPEVVEKLVIMAAPHPASLIRGIFHPAQFLRTSYIFTFQVPLLPEIVMSKSDFSTLTAALRSRQTGPRRRDAVTRADVDKYKAALGQPGALTATVNYYRAGMRDVLFNRSHPDICRLLDNDGAAKVIAPVLVLWADQDMALGPRLRDGLEEIAPNMQLHVLSNCSHWIPYDQPDVVNSLMKSFLAEDAVAPLPAGAKDVGAEGTDTTGVKRRATSAQQSAPQQEAAA